MPWKESSQMDERMRFLVRLQAGERMTDLCNEFGISRKTGHKFKKRYKKFGPLGLADESRRPITNPKKYPDEIRNLAVSLKNDKPTWGPRKIREQLIKRNPGIKVPSATTVFSILLSKGLVTPRKRTRRGGSEVFQTPGKYVQTKKPNEVWCTDFKGEFLLGNQKYCYPLTVTDHSSRYLIGCEALDSTKGAGALKVFEETFQEYGLPDAILSDNGPPFGTTGLLSLSKLAVYWIRLGIKILRIEPGHPEQNGRHERMHLTLKQETTRPAGANLLQQQERFDSFRHEYNFERPHEALDMQCPATKYQRSLRMYPKHLPEPEYALYDTTRVVNRCGHISFKGRGTNFFLTEALAGQKVGLIEEDSQIWRVSFGNLDLGFYDEHERKFSPVRPGALSIQEANKVEQ